MEVATSSIESPEDELLDLFTSHRNDPKSAIASLFKVFLSADKYIRALLVLFREPNSLGRCASISLGHSFKQVCEWSRKQHGTRPWERHRNCC